MSNPAPPDTHIALLRGINVGGKNKLPKADLIALFAEAGCQEVQTYIQSGNIVFRAPEALVTGLAAAIASRILERFGFTVPVVLRTRQELLDAASHNPFLPAGAEPDTLAVMFLAAVPDAARVAALDPRRSPGDAFALRGRDVYLHVPTGLADTKLTNAYFDAKLATVSTVRNWRTVLKLVEMAGAPG